MTLTPDQIKQGATNAVRASYPTKGTIFCLIAYNEAVSFIVNAPKESVINYCQERLEANKAWSTEIIKAVVTRWPTLPLPEKPITPVDLPIVKLDPQKKEVRWTCDGWASYEGRKLATVIGGKTNKDDWTAFTGTNAIQTAGAGCTNNNKSTKPACAAG